MYSRETINELNELSKEVFGSASKWRKLVEKGSAELLVEDSTRLKADGTKETVKTTLMHVGKNGGEIPQSQIVRYTPETIKEKMLFIKQQREHIIATIKKQQEEQKAAKEAISQASGSSV